MRSMSLRRLFHPASIAVVGASAAVDKAGYQALRSLQRFPGKLYPINPKAQEVLGFQGYPSLAAVGASVDLALFAIPARATPAAVRAAASAGCGAGMIISGGFGESGPEGVALQASLAQALAGSGMRLLGPNTSGFIHPHAGVAASFAPGVEEIQPGAIAVVAQSGGVNLVLTFMLQHAGYGVSLAVGLGNMVDIDAADCLEYVLGDPHTRAIALHLEGVSDGRKLYETLARVTPAKPVVVLPVGQADVGEFAASHTGNLLGVYARKRAALKQAGAVVVESTEALVDATIALSRGRMGAKSAPGIGLVTAQAGPGLIIADRLKSHGVCLPALGAPTLARIAAVLPPLTFQRNPVDTARPLPSFPEVLATVAQDPAIDAVATFVLHEPAAVDPLAALTNAARVSPKPLLFGTAGTPGSIAATLQAITTAGIAAFGSPDRLAAAVCALADDAIGQHRLAQARDPIPRRASEIDEALDEAAAKRLLAAHGIAVPESVVCATHAAAHGAFARLDKPVVAKILASEIAHKTEVGGVQLGIATSTQLDAALEQLDAIALSGPRRYLLETMAPPGLELIVGGVRDASFGPLVLVGLGGTLAEALEDTSVRLAPLGEFDALEMLAELKGAKLLDAFRGQPAVNRRAIANVAIALGRIMLAHPEIAEIDPVRAYPRGAIALDALIVRGR
jgi:acetyltransferase